MQYITIICDLILKNWPSMHIYISRITNLKYWMQRAFLWFNTVMPDILYKTLTSIHK